MRFSSQLNRHGMLTCALWDLSLPALPGAPARGVAAHRVAGDAAVVAELARNLHRAVDRLLGLTALRVTCERHAGLFRGF